MVLIYQFFEYFFVTCLFYVNIINWRKKWIDGTSVVNMNIFLEQGFI